MTAKAVEMSDSITDHTSFNEVVSPSHVVYTNMPIFRPTKRRLEGKLLSKI